MAWLMVGVTGVLTLLVVALAVLVLRLDRRVAALESPLGSASSEIPGSSAGHIHDAGMSLDEKLPEPAVVITRIGELEPEPVATVPVPVFADIVARETVIQAASLAAGLRRALDPETRNRIRFHMRQEVRRSRKQRKSELREVRREWAARQREAAGEAGAA